MATRNGNKVPSDIAAADSISFDSLSFSGLVSVQEQQPKSPSLPLNQAELYDQMTNQSPEFEFSITKPTSNSAANSIKNTPANLLISIGQLQPHALAFQSNQSLKTDPHGSSLSSLLATHSSGKRLSSGHSSSTRKFDGVEKGRKPRSKFFGRKVFKSLVSPCRECQTIKRNVKIH